MSAREIIAEIEALPAHEKAEIVRYLSQLGSTKASRQIRYATDEQFEKAREEVFTLHAPLLKKLAES